MKGGRRFVNTAKSGRVAAQRRAGAAVRGRAGMASARGVAKNKGPAPAGPRTRHR